MSFCDYSIEWFIEHLERDIEAHESGRYGDIGVAFDEMPEWSLCEDETHRHRLTIAYNFWDEWIDARNHGWADFHGWKEDDWPIVARQICQGLREKWEPERMEANAVFRPPLAPPRVPLWRRVRHLFSP